MDWTKDWTKKENWHEYANLFPLMNPNEFADLVAGIKANGLRHKIVLFEDKILDGRNRALACAENGITLTAEHFEQFDSTNDSPFDYVWDENHRRRQLTTDQQAAIAAELKEILSDEAKRRQIEAGRQGGRGKKRKTLAGIPAKGGYGKAAALAAAQFPDVSRDAVERIVALEKAMPGTRDKIKGGSITIRAAEKEWEQSPTNPRQRKILADFLVSPPFSFLDPTADYWKKRKLEWASIFDPVLWECMIRWFAPTTGGRILDPFAGGSTRGIIAAYLGYQYTGIEWRPGQAEINVRQVDAVKVVTPSLRQFPTWIQANGAQTALPDNDSYDMVLTSAPLYSGNEEDRARWGSYEEFLSWYESVCGLAVARLKDNRFLIVAVEELTDEDGIIRSFVEQNITAFKRLGLAHYNRILLRTYPELPPWTFAPARYVQIGCFWKGEARELARVHEHIGSIPMEKLGPLTMPPKVQPEPGT